MKDKKIILLAIIFVLLVTVLGVSYAYFSAKILGEGQENIVKAGTMELTFVDNNSINILNGKPGDSDSKTFTVENTGTIEEELKYNIKLTELTVTFKKEDLKYTLVEYNDGTYGTPKDGGINVTGFINEDTVNENSEMYLVLDIPAPKLKQKHYYKLTIEFQELDKPQDYNQGAEFSGKINVDDKEGAMLYDELQDHPFYETMMSNPSEVAKDDFGNLRYIGKEPNNYIWFNCESYDGITKDNATDDDHACERWRIIGLFKDIMTVTEDGQDKETENLVKIVRAEGIGDIEWDRYQKNDWTNASLQKTLNGDYLNPEDNGNYTSESEIKAIAGETSRRWIKNVKWNLGGASSDEMIASKFYEAERGSVVYEEQPITWNGKIGLMYPSDYGYATGGGTTKTRKDCLEHELSDWSSSDYKSDCAGNDWLLDNDRTQYTIMPFSGNGKDVFYISTAGGFVGYYQDYWVYDTYFVRPTLFLTNYIYIEQGSGSYSDPYAIAERVSI